MDLDNRAYKASRLENIEGLQLTDTTYNLAIGGTLLWGILINVFMARFLTDHILHMNYILVLVLYLAGSIGCMFLVYKSTSPVVSFLGFTGLALSMGLLLTYYLTSFSGQQITDAFLMCGIVTVAMMLAATIFPQVFAGIGRALGLALVVTIVVELVAALFFRRSLVITDYIMVLIFSGYVGFDWAKAQAYPRTLDNAVDSAADIYVDIVNLFIRILSIISRKDD